MMHGEISYEMTFDAGHRIVGHKGKCARLHGHTYKVHIMASGSVHEPGFVVDFGDLKDIVNEWDHKMLLWNEDLPRLKYLSKIEEEKELGIVRLPFNPTAEHMAQHLAEKIYEEFGLISIMVELWETPKCMARYVIES
jgi:6-pyruvoyltetrahydropterin/6-carboxytetrahydropterin synthase